MAQHIEIRHPHASKILQKIGAGIEREVAKGLSYTSMKWNFTGLVPDTAIAKWETTRYIGKGIVHGETHGNFEVHVKGRIAEHIYLVA